MLVAQFLQAGEGAAGVTFTPVKMAVHCWRDLWDTANTHSRAAEGMALSMSEFAQFKMRTWSVRGRQWRRKPAKKGGPAEAVSIRSKAYFVARFLDNFSCLIQIRSDLFSKGGGVQPTLSSAVWSFLTVETEIGRECTPYG